MHGVDTNRRVAGLYVADVSVILYSIHLNRFLIDGSDCAALRHSDRNELYLHSVSIFHASLMMQSSDVFRAGVPQ